MHVHGEGCFIFCQRNLEEVDNYCFLSMVHAESAYASGGGRGYPSHEGVGLNLNSGIQRDTGAELYPRVGEAMRPQINGWDD